jgi:phosphoglycolate phosphatase
VLLDWDDTLVDNWASIHAAMNATLAAMDRPAWTLEQTRRGPPVSCATASRAFRRALEEARDLFYGAFSANHLQFLKPLPGADGLLSGLARAGIYLGVVSNKTGSFLREEAAHLGWTGYFGAIVGATDAAEDKPASAPVKLALEGSGVAPGPSVWFVGDGPVDMECAHRAACAAVLVRRGEADPEDFRLHPPHARVGTLGELGVLALGP